MNRLQFGPLALLDAQANPVATISTESNTNKNAEAKTDDIGQIPKSSAKLPSYRPGNRIQEKDSKPSLVPSSPLAYRFFIPQGFERNYAYPLVVYLHDRCQNEGRIDQVMPSISTKNYVGVSVAAPKSAFEGDVWGQDPSTIQASRLGVLEAIETAKRRFKINAQKVFLIGHGSGGTMAFRIANSDPEKFAGIASINGAFPGNHSPLSQLKLARHLDIFWAHYQTSDRFTESDLCSEMSLLHTAGFNLTVRQYPFGDRKELSPVIFRDINRWAMDLVCKS